MAYDSELSCRIGNFKVECSVICNVSLRTKNLYGKYIFKDDRNVSRKISITLSSPFLHNLLKSGFLIKIICMFMVNFIFKTRINKLK